MSADNEVITVSDLAGFPLRLHWMNGEETLGSHMAGMFEYRLEVASLMDDIKAKDVLGQKLTINVPLPEGGFRYFNGHVASWSYHGTRDDRAIYHATVHPWLWFLSFTSDCRVFNNKSVVDIAKIIFGKYRDADFDQILSADYPVHEYVVQYRETDFNFVCRLLQQDGIYFYFRHDAKRHQLVLSDGTGSHETATGFEEIPYIPPSTSAKQHEANFDHWKMSQDLDLKTYRVHDYDYERPRTDLPGVGDADPKQERVFVGEVFDYPGMYVDQGRGQALANMRLEELHAEAQSIEVQGNPWGLGTGNIFTFLNPPRSDKPVDYLVTSAHYDLWAPEERSGGNDQDQPPYRATYNLMPTSEQFRPRRISPRPTIVGPQTAVVVGIKKTADPEPEEIVTDLYGRVRIRFHWERIGDRHPDIRGPRDAEEEDDTCWVRVAQMWAGSKWGAIHIPRVGQEVVVNFLEGDPDRPLIIGSVYNGDNMPPYDLPTNKTQSGLKSRSSKGGNSNNFNEVRFEDLKGKEELHIQAEKDMSTLVKNNQSTSVGADRSVSVGGNHSVSVTGKQDTTVTKDETQTYKANRKMTVALTNTDEITGAHTGTYKSTRTETVDGADGLKVTKGNKTVDVLAGEYNSTAKTQYKVVQGAANVIFMKEPDIVISNGKCEISLSAGDATVVAADSLTLKCGGAAISLKKDGTIEINGSQKVAIGGGTSTVELDQAGAKMSGMKVGISGQAVTEITGALIKIN